MSPDASNLGFKDYRVWFHFGIRGLRKGSFFRITLMNLSNLKLFGSAIYRPVWKTLPSQPEWQRTRTDSTFQANPPNGYKLSWVFEMPFEDNVVYFAFAPPYPYEEVLKTIEACQEACPPDALLYRETLARSLDNRNIDLLTISNKENFKQKREARQELLFPTHQPRCYAGTKPVVFATARVHPGETPASFMMDGFLKAVLALDKKGDPYVAITEGIKHPLYTVMFHPEKPAYEWKSCMDYPHDILAIEVGQYFATFFATEARKSSNSFEDFSEFSEYSIYNHPLIHIHQPFEQVYIFN